MQLIWKYTLAFNYRMFFMPYLFCKCRCIVRRTISYTQKTIPIPDFRDSVKNVPRGKMEMIQSAQINPLPPLISNGLLPIVPFVFLLWSKICRADYNNWVALFLITFPSYTCRCLIFPSSKQDYGNDSKILYKTFFFRTKFHIYFHIFYSFLSRYALRIAHAQLNSYYDEPSFLGFRT